MRHLLPAAAILAALFLPYAVRAADAPTLAVLPFEIQDNSGEIGVAARLDDSMIRLTDYLRQEIEKAGLYEVVSKEKTEAAVEAQELGTWIHHCNNCLVPIGERAGAERVMHAWIYKVSRLILQLHGEIRDTGTGELVWRQDFDFRGDNDKAFQRAVDYMVEAIAEKTAGAR